jgi:polyisoprenyl-teichoic acid--peptidoglycan teichoic acid transferase
MSNNFNNNNPPDNPQPGKLVLRNGQVRSGGNQQAPYQPPSSPQAPQQSPNHYNNGQQAYPYQHGQNAGSVGQQGYQQRAGYNNAHAPYGQAGPNVQPGWGANQGYQPPMGQRPPQERRRRSRLPGCLIALLVVVIVAVLFFSTMQKVLAFGSAISPKTPLSTQTSYMSTGDRVNVLIMGYGGGSHDGAYLTDSLVVASVLPQNRHTTLVSVPRDLWVSNPPGSSTYTKINAVYTVASNNNQNPVTGGDIMAQKVSTITGLNVKYWMTIDFSGFKQLIDSIGGIDVYVPDSFNACYPKNDDAAVDASWIKVQFKKGTQHMDGATAIEYARAREPLEVCGMGTSENEAELSDFARSARQMIIIKAVETKIKQITTWPKLFDAMNALQKTVYTNMSFADLSLFALKLNLDDPKTARIGLSTSNVLQNGFSDDGQDILEPTNDDWTVIPPYIKSHLYN